MQIFVRANRLFVLEVEPDTTLDEVKEMIMDREGYPSEIYYLIHNGRILSKGTMKELNITRESLIHLNFRFGSIKKSD